MSTAKNPREADSLLYLLRGQDVVAPLLLKNPRFSTLTPLAALLHGELPFSDPLPSPAPATRTFKRKNSPELEEFLLCELRGRDLHPRPQGYEPCELLLLHPAFDRVLQRNARRNFLMGDRGENDL